MHIVNLTDEYEINLPPQGNFKWGFTTRLGGDSLPPYDCNNLGDHVGDNLETVWHNRQQLMERIAPQKNLSWLSVRQVHGTAVYHADHYPNTKMENPPEADIIIATRPGFCLAILVADCVPVILLDPKLGHYAVAHCGWRGTASCGATKAVQELLNYGSNPANIFGAIGPAIGPCCFATGPEVIEALQASHPAHQILESSTYPDLKKICLNELLTAGIIDSHLYYCPYCTKCNPRLFFSYRNSAQTGRFAGYIALPNS